MSALNKVFALLQVFVKVSGQECAHLRIYDDQSCSVHAPGGATLTEFDSFEEGVDRLTKLIIEAVG